MKKEIYLKLGVIGFVSMMSLAPHIGLAAQPNGFGYAWGSAREAYSEDYWSQPARLIIPSIGLDSSVDHMGINTKGEMDVPDGDTANVGWYKYGTVPGRVGSAVLAAHVYAAFNNLKYVPPGSDLYVIARDGSVKKFKVMEKSVYDLNQLSSQFLFGVNDAERLNLITCEGDYLANLGTYSQRLVVRALLVS